jgi:hypothetical protein
MNDEKWLSRIFEKKRNSSIKYRNVCQLYYSGSKGYHFSQRTAPTIFLILCMKLDIDKWWKVTELNFWKKLGSSIKYRKMC